MRPSHTMKRNKYPSQPSKTAAFTLIEVLAAVSIMAFLILGVFSITTNVMTAWTRSISQLTSNHEGRLALDLIAQDLEAAFMRRNGQNWIEVNYDSPDEFYTSIGAGPARLYFFSPVLPRPRTDGNICAVFNGLAYSNPFTGMPGDDYDSNTLSGLYRIVVDPVNTFNVVLREASIRNPDGTFPMLSSIWNKGFSSQREDETGSRPVSDRAVDFRGEDFLGANVVDFRVSVIFRTKNEDGTYEMEIHPEPTTPPANRTGFRLTPELHLNGIPRPDAEVLGIEIELTIVGNEGSDLLRQSAMRNQDNVKRHGAVFTRRVNLPDGLL